MLKEEFILHIFYFVLEDGLSGAYCVIAVRDV